MRTLLNSLFRKQEHPLIHIFKKYAAIISITAFLLVAAWLTHIIHCLGTGEWGFLIAGALFFPIAMVHGIGLWFGAF